MPINSIELDTNVRRQMIEGFGASGAWWAQHIGGWEEEVRQRVIRLLFDPQAGIGLTIYRYNIGAGSAKEIARSWTRTESFEVGRHLYDWSRDRNAVWVLKAAHAAGAEKIIAFANSPPGRMTRSGRADRATDRSIREIDDLSAALGDIFNLLMGKKTIEAQGYSNLRHEMIDECFQQLDPPAATRYARRRCPQVKLWMTEWVEMAAAPDEGIEPALLMANVIHADLTVGQVSSWQYWLAVSFNAGWRDGLLKTNLETHTLQISKRL